MLVPPKVVVPKPVGNVEVPLKFNKASSDTEKVSPEPPTIAKPPLFKVPVSIFILPVTLAVEMAAEIVAPLG